MVEIPPNINFSDALIMYISDRKTINIIIIIMIIVGRQTLYIHAHHPKPALFYEFTPRSQWTLTLRQRVTKKFLSGLVVLTLCLLYYN
jgi:hypothetical protein